LAEENKLIVREALAWATQELEASRVPDSRTEAEYLLTFALRVKRHELYLYPERTLTGKESSEFSGSIRKRALREPAQYITGETEFRGLVFKVSPEVLIPRPETELLVEEAVDFLKGFKGEEIVIDLCTGSGCVAVSIAKERSNTLVYAVDISKEALKVASLNAGINGVASSVKFINGDLFALLSELKGKARVIVSNPPYVSKEEIEKLDPEVRDYEPMIALNGGADGLEFIKRIIEDAPGYLLSGGRLMMEIGWGQAERVKEIITRHGLYRDIEIRKDLSGIERVVKASYAGEGS
jgi:release factor glutamine methyltransferase